jgi:glycosidase
MSRPHLAAALAGLLVAACGGGGGADAGAGTPGPDNGVTLPVDVSAVAAADPGSALPASWRQGAFMQVFVRSYKDSDGDGFGDLRGLTAQLDYLRDLGITGLWLMPVTQSQDRDHGYAVADHRAIEAHYGSLADFDELLRQAHARGIGVIVDYVFNHSAAQNPLFQNARSAASNPYRDWYVWAGLKPGGWSIYGGDPWRGSPGNYYFAPFWDQMPDWNLLNPRVVAYHHDNLRFWLNRGVDGFRFDAVGNLVENGAGAWENQPQNYNLLREVRNLVGGYAQRFLVCEGPSDPFGYAVACGSAFAFNNTRNLFAAARGDAQAVRAVADFHLGAPPGLATMLANHDSFAGDRVFNQFGGNLAQYRLAAATYLLQPGVPFVYYGEEIGMARGSAGGDPGLRTPMSWTASTATAGFTTGTPYRSLAANVATHNVAAQQADAGSLLNFYRALLTLRKGRPSIAGGSYDNVSAAGTLLAFERRAGNERSLVVINYGSAPASAELAGLGPGTVAQGLHPAGSGGFTADAAGRFTLPLAAQSVRVFDLR